METEAILESILNKAKADPETAARLLAAASGELPVASFCGEARNMGYILNEMDLIYAGEEAYAAMRRSTNGGGENSPLLAGEDDYFELFLTKLRGIAEGHTENENRGGKGAVRFEMKPLPGEGKEVPALQDAIGVFDSGVGGISVLREMVRLLPEEKFFYFGDSAHAPYGEKTEDWVRERSLSIASNMVRGGVKAIAIACNTATAAAAASIRSAFPEIPVIGVEPALNVAVRKHQGKCFLVMATEVTLRLEKYHTLEERLAGDARFIPLPCDGLAARIEKGNLDGDDLHELLEHLLSPYIGEVDGIVLGCTHYPLIKRQIMEIMGDLPLYDGGEGTARELVRRLNEAALRRKTGTAGEVVLYSSKREEGQKELYEWFYRLAGEEAL